MRGKVVIAGIGETAFGKHPGRERLALIAEACANAVADAGIEKSRIDGLLVKMPTSEPQILFGQKVAEALGLKPRIGCALDQGGAANIGLISYASLAIEAGMIDIAVVVYGDTPRTGSRASYHRPRGADSVYGWYSTAAGYAMIHQAYKQKYAAKDEYFGQVAVTSRAHGAENPQAQLRKPITMDDYLASPWIVEPLRKDDCCLVSDGAIAIVLMSERKARELGIDRPVPILGLGQAQESWDVHLRRDLTSTVAKYSATAALADAGLTPRDIDVAQIYDCFTITVLMTLEDYGFCKPGQAGDFCADVGIGMGGGLPLNTRGGLLSETGLPGLNLVAEGVRQMRGTARLQVGNARNCLVSNQGGTMHTHATMVLGRAA